MSKETKKSIFAKIDSREDALRVVKDASSAFFFIAGLQILVAFLLGFSLLLDAGIYIICGFFIRRFNSRVAAIVVLLLSLLSIATTIGNLLGADLGGGSNIVLAVIVLAVAVRTVEATFKLHGPFAVASPTE